MTDAVEKGFSGVALKRRARTGFLDLTPGRNNDSLSSRWRNQILSVYHMIRRKSDVFDSIDPPQTWSAISARLLRELLALLLPTANALGKPSTRVTTLAERADAVHQSTAQNLESSNRCRGRGSERGG
jgi:hypothetical protein